jgi:tRNA G26 N,N-dimethylase Trm1
MFKKPFNRSVGETRECKYCGNTFHAKKPIWKCQTCVNAAQKIIEQMKRAQYAKKDRYPFDTRTPAADKRFNSIRTALSNAWKEYNRTGDKSYVTNHYDKQIKEIKDNGIMEWILDRRTPEAKRENNPNLRSRNMIAKDLPDTRGHYEY